MRIPCPICGDRDLREFTYAGVAAQRPNPDAGSAAWHDYVHLRDNPAGETQDLWVHGAGCGAWLIVTRNTVTHAVKNARLAREGAVS
jgi:sarcosine oxidase subunit delta